VIKPTEPQYTKWFCDSMPFKGTCIALVGMSTMQRRGLPDRLALWEGGGYCFLEMKTDQAKLRASQFQFLRLCQRFSTNYAIVRFFSFYNICVDFPINDGKMLRKRFVDAKTAWLAIKEKTDGTVD